jgi:hypothetical protein
MFLKDGVYIKGIMEYDLDKTTWRFSQQRRNGVELWGVSLPNLHKIFRNISMTARLFRAGIKRVDFNHLMFLSVMLVTFPRLVFQRLFRLVR